jgi:1-acyl-sn-glycerol-3-phosphate acyltransferase
MSTHAPRGETVRRRLISIPAVVLAGVALLVLLPIWLPVALIVDLVSDRRRLPRTRLLLFALCWTWLETAALVRLCWIWVTGGAHDMRRMTAAQRWWASGLLGALRLTTGLRVKVEGIDAFHPAPVVLLARHACLADSLVSAWVVAGPADLQLRFVIKRELLSDPCLDVAGNRLHNHFVDRGATDSAPELAALTELTSDMGDDTCAVIFPEGTRANPEKRARALARIAERDPARAERLSALEHLNPPRPAGSAALLAGAPDADVVVAWHTGFEGMDTFGGILRNLPPLSGRTIRYVARRVPRAEVPSGEAFTSWLDKTWLELDRTVGAALAAEAAL